MGGKEERRSHSEEETRHERMNPDRKDRGTVGREAASAVETHDGARATGNPIARSSNRHTTLCSRLNLTGGRREFS